MYYDEDNLTSERKELGELPGGDDRNQQVLVYYADDEQFIRGVMERDPKQGCDLLFRRYFVPLCSHAIRFCASRAIAEDLVSEVFLDLYANNGFKGIANSYRAYLYQAVRNRAYNYLRHTLKRDAGLEEVTYRSIPENQQPDAVTQYEELRRDMEMALERLPIARRRIYLMNRFEGKKYKEIAEELRISERTVEVQIRKASFQMRELLREKWIET